MANISDDFRNMKSEHLDIENEEVMQEYIMEEEDETPDLCDRMGTSMHFHEDDE